MEIYEEQKRNILLIDDDRTMCELISDFLTDESFTVKVAASSPEGLEMALTGVYEIVILDVMMPKLNGFEVLRQIRRTGNETPVLMLTARGSDVDRIVGLEIGADDYLPKPFNPRELTARLRAILRRTNKSNNAETTAENLKPITIGDVELNLGTRIVKCNGQIIDLTNVEYEILVILIQSVGHIVSREVLVRAVLGRDLSPFDRSIDTHVSHLRKKLGHYCGEVERIKTVRGVGYIYARLSQFD